MNVIRLAQRFILLRLMQRSAITLCVFELVAICVVFDVAGLQLSAVESREAVVCADFELRDYRGQSWRLSQSKQPYTVLAFLGTECPLANLYAPRLNVLATEYSEQVAFVGLNSNYQDSVTELAAYARRHKLKFPLLKDLQHRVADQLTAQRTPEVYLLDRKGRVRYHGRIDDQYGVGYSRPEPRREDLRAAISELLAGQPVSVEATAAVGCFIGRMPRKVTNEQITFSNQVSRVLQRNCVQCHRAGEIAPFALTSYDEVVGWGETIREVIEERRMPPWHANPDYGEFSNAREISPEDKQMLFQWIDNGMPEGEESELPEPIEYVADWRLPKLPDRVIAMSESPFEVPAEGTVEYQYFVVDPQLAEESWISAAEVVPGNRRVVHHAIVFVRPPEGERQEGIGWLTAYVPGQSVMVLPKGFARRMPARSKLVFQLHYTPTGSPEHDITRLGLIFADRSEVHTEAQTRLIINRDFEIPPGVASYDVHMSADNFPRDSQLLSIAPHMHWRGSQFRVTVNSNSSPKILLDVPNYDFNWQHAYALKTPLPLQNMRIECRARFDNSEQNLVNPDPTASVRWGDQTWEEMAMAYLELAIPLAGGEQLRADQILVQTAASQTIEPRSREEHSTPAQQAIEITRNFFAKLDVNSDREILPAETPKAFRAFAWKFYDVNQDGRLTWDEVLRQARLSQRP